MTALRPVTPVKRGRGCLPCMLLLAFLVCGGIALGIDACIRFQSAWAGWIVLVLAAVWEPLNNKRMEGHVLLNLGNGHGVTWADLLGLAGFMVATMKIVRPYDRKSWREGEVGAASAKLLACLVIFGSGVIAASATG